MSKQKFIKTDAEIDALIGDQHSFPDRLDETTRADIRDMAPYLPGQADGVIDLGCGSGRLSVGLHRLYSGWKAKYWLVDGDARNIQRFWGKYGNDLVPRFYNRRELTERLCDLNGLTNYEYVIIDDGMRWSKLPDPADMLVSNRAIGWHFPLDMYESLYPRILRPGARCFFMFDPRMGPIPSCFRILDVICESEQKHPRSILVLEMTGEATQRIIHIGAPDTLVIDHQSPVRFAWTVNGLNMSTWTAAYTATADRLADFDRSADCILSIPEEKRCLLSLCGMNFLEPMSRIRFERIVFFDMNINEMSKLRLVLQHLRDTEYSEFNGFGWLDSYIRDDPVGFYMPGPLRDCRIDAVSDTMTITPAACNVEVSRWNPTSAEYEMVRDNLTRIDSKFYLGLPALDLGDWAVIAQLSNSSIKEELVKERINARWICVWRSFKRLPSTVYARLNAHELWMDEILDIPLRYGQTPETCAEVLRDKSPTHKRKADGRGFFVGRDKIRVSAASKLEKSKAYDVVVTHLLASYISVRAMKTAVQRLLRPGTAKLLIVSEHNAACGRFEQIPCSDELTSVLKGLCLKVRGSDKIDISYSGGMGHPQRNIFFTINV